MPIVVLTLRAVTVTFGITWFHCTTTTAFLGFALLFAGTEGPRCVQTLPFGHGVRFVMYPLPLLC